MTDINETNNTSGANQSLATAHGSQTDTDRLDWIERKQLSGEYIHDAIHWDGRKIRQYIDDMMRGENTED